MKIGISTASFYPTEIEQGIRNAAELGFQRVELFINSESEYVPPLRTELKKQLDALGLQAISLHPYTSALEGHLLFSDYPRRTRDALDQYARYFEAAAELGASYFTFHGELLRARGLPPAQVESRRFETYHMLCERAAQYDICFTQENVSWCKSSDVVFLKKLYDNVPELRYTLDIKQAHRAGRTWGDYMDTVGDRIVNLHISDYTEQTDYLLPGQGDVDFSALFRRLEACGYQGSALVEVYSSDYTALEQLAHSRLYLEAVDQQKGGNGL
ncbi:MAG: sugar phosphate isomerase/epimerase [Eubacteriales bacterium]|nr:sugar phosphate isomerase/epimerase [Eubacteriales bacterium]